MAVKCLRAKRLMDVAVTVPALLVLSPVMLATAVGVRLTMGSPVLFTQERAGLNGEPFTLLKFRSMLPQDPERTWENEHDESYRMTRLGDFIRRTSLDELPSLINILRGDLSLVGPRPLHTEYLEHYSPHQARRHEVRPGLTGLAQVSGRNHLTWEERFDLDVEYVDTHSLLLDVKILIRTVGVVFAREGITPEAGHTMPLFAGSGSKSGGESGPAGPGYRD